GTGEQAARRPPTLAREGGAGCQQDHRLKTDMVFDYPPNFHLRRHGPRDYLDYRSYKPWLRDEFEFRCIYCLWRERWEANGEYAFSVEHLRGQADHPELACEYDNLGYACCFCNALKQDGDLPLNPCFDPLGRHLAVRDDGTVHALTPQGANLIVTCRPDRPR